MKRVAAPRKLPDLAKLELRRRSLGIAKSVLAKNTGASLKTLDRLLLGRDRNPRLATLHAIASALGVTVSVGAESQINEAVTADEMRRRRAFEKAQRLTAGVQASMGLEAQAINAAERASLVERTMHKLLAGSGRRLWED